MHFARFLSIVLPFVLSCTFAPQLAQADVYTWKDASGRMNVSNLPPPEGAKVGHVVHEKRRSRRQPIALAKPRGKPKSARYRSGCSSSRPRKAKREAPCLPT